MDITGGMVFSGDMTLIPAPLESGNKAIFGHGYTTTEVSITNLVSNTGVIGNDVTSVGTARGYLAAAAYG